METKFSASNGTTFMALNLEPSSFGFLVYGLLRGFSYTQMVEVMICNIYLFSILIISIIVNLENVISDYAKLLKMTLELSGNIRIDEDVLIKFIGFLACILYNKN